MPKSSTPNYEVKRSFEQYLLPKFGKLKARELKRADARAFLDGMAQSKSVMANRCLAHVRKMYNWALSKDLVEFNPITAIPRPGTEKTRDRVLSADEIKALWMALDKEKPIMAATFRLRLLTAQREGEVHAMRWQDIDGEWWTIPSEFSKNKLSHRVPFSPQALKVLSEVKETTDRMDEKMGRERSEWVLPNPADKSQHVYSIQKLAQRVRANSKVSYRAHDLRRTAASIMTGMGVPRLVVGKILNHAEPGVTKVYDRHSYDGEKQEALNAWGARVGSIVNPDKEERESTTAKVVPISAGSKSNLTRLFKKVEPLCKTLSRTGAQQKLLRTAALKQIHRSLFRKKITIGLFRRGDIFKVSSIDNIERAAWRNQLGSP
jgi:integrase